jgi:flavorubredoxin
MFQQTTFFWDNEVLKTGKRILRFIMTPHVHHWDSMMIFDDTTKSLFPSDLFLQPGANKPVLSEDLSEARLLLTERLESLVAKNR